MKQFLVFLVVVLAGQIAWAGRAPIQDLAADPYVSAVVLDADTGETLFAENADVPVYPASVLKLMDLLVILEGVEQGTLKLDDLVQVTREANKMGGSQVYLDPKEQFPVEELLYALMVQSANDAAVTLATHVAGSKEGFVALMNKRAAELGMKNTRFYSVHGLPPADGQEADVTTARDFAILCRELAKRPEVFAYTGTKVRDFRQGAFTMRNHNHLLENVDGCDGFKTGYFKAAGFSIAATAKRNGVRIIALVMGSKDRKVRDAKATELLAKGFAKVPAKPEQKVAATQPTAKPTVTDSSVPAGPGSPIPAGEMEGAAPSSSGGKGWTKFFMGLGAGFALFAAVAFLVLKKFSGKSDTFLHRR